MRGLSFEVMKYIKFKQTLNVVSLLNFVPAAASFEVAAGQLGRLGQENKFFDLKIVFTYTIYFSNRKLEEAVPRSLCNLRP